MLQSTTKFVFIAMFCYSSDQSQFPFYSNFYNWSLPSSPPLTKSSYMSQKLSNIMILLDPQLSAVSFSTFQKLAWPEKPSPSLLNIFYFSCLSFIPTTFHILLKTTRLQPLCHFYYDQNRLEGDGLKFYRRLIEVNIRDNHEIFARRRLQSVRVCWGGAYARVYVENTVSREGNNRGQTAKPLHFVSYP